MTRIHSVQGDEPFLIVAPHGHQDDDMNTAIVAAKMAIALKCDAVINTGWHRGKSIIINEDQANLNSINHSQHPFIRIEWLDKIIGAHQRLVNKHGWCHVYLIHGMSHLIQRRAQENVHVVIGDGNGEPPAFTCSLHHKNYFAWLLQKAGLCIYQGKPKGRFSGWHKDNLNQLFPKKNTQSLQLELISGLRSTSECSQMTGEILAKAAEQVAANQDTGIPVDFNLKEI